MFIGVLITGFSIAGIIMYFFLNSFVTDEKAREMEQSSNNVSEFFKLYIENYNKPVSRLLASDLFMSALESSSRNTGTMIWIVDKNGYIYFSMPELPAQLKGKLADEEGRIKLPDERQYKKIMSGRETVVKEVGDFYGFFKDSAWDEFERDSWLTVEKLFRFRPSYSDEEVVWAVYLHKPLPEINRVRASVFRFFIISAGVAVLVSTVLAYVFSLKISTPLKQINDAARIIASGEFNNRLNIKAKDEIGELAQSFNQMASALQNIEEMRRGFIANVSHELRTPMTSIRGFIEGILDGTIPPEKHKDYLLIVKDEAERLNRLVNDLLDLAKMEAGEATLVKRSFNINELVRRCIIKFENLIVNKDIQVEVDFEEEDMYVHADPDAIERVIYNLMHNALKFTPEGGRIVLRVGSNKEKILVSVEDNGIGIAADDLSRIWERFYKSDKSRGKDKTGTGLGLAIVKSIINEHGQEIWVASKPGAGTRFTFTLEKV